MQMTIAVCGDRVGHRQAQIICLERFCKMRGMKFNLKKSKVMVFSNGGIIRKDEKWYYEGKTNRGCTILQISRVNNKYSYELVHCKKNTVRASQQSAV